MVISANGSGMYQHPEAMATYWDLLARDAFGNFRQLLEDVTLNPGMGDFLDMVHNDKPNPSRNTQPNENYAREIMQLFTIGLYKLNQDGTQQLDINGQPIPTYDQDVVEGNAHLELCAVRLSRPDDGVPQPSRHRCKNDLKRCYFTGRSDAGPGFERLSRCNFQSSERRPVHCQAIDSTFGHQQSVTGLHFAHRGRVCEQRQRRSRRHERGDSRDSA